MSETGHEILDNKSEIENLNATTEQLQEFSDIVRKRTQFYKEENAKFEEIFGRLKLLNEDLKLIGLGSENCDKSIVQLEPKTSNVDRVSLSQAERLRKQNNYLAKLKICIRHYININSTIAKRIKFLKCESEQSAQNVNSILKVSIQDIPQLEEKAKKYENELVKFEKKYPWLKNSEYDLSNISKYIENLNLLREEKDNLVKELNAYKNLKPDIKEAKKQLTELKDQIRSAVVGFKL